MGQMQGAKQVTLCAMLTALALALSYIERLFPLILLIPLPGVRLGLSNVVTLFALVALGSRPALLILGCRCLLGAVFAGNVSALLFSLLGGFFAMGIMLLLKSAGGFSLFGISVGGAAAHNVGQVCAALLTLDSTAALYYLPPLLLVSLLTGLLNAALTGLLLRGLEQVRWMHR